VASRRHGRIRASAAARRSNCGVKLPSSKWSGYSTCKMTFAQGHISLSRMSIPRVRHWQSFLQGKAGGSEGHCRLSTGEEPITPPGTRTRDIGTCGAQLEGPGRRRHRGCGAVRPPLETVCTRTREDILLSPVTSFERQEPDVMKAHPTFPLRVVHPRTTARRCEPARPSSLRAAATSTLDPSGVFY